MNEAFYFLTSSFSWTRSKVNLMIDFDGFIFLLT
ncbi:hypothetical protein X962_5543 [Burkholderia pseudomallei MSHR7343]|nr:hypothetical protein X962_5543 [Burkholderia pseudomallei MSHR7343]